MDRVEAKSIPANNIFSPKKDRTPYRSYFFVLIQNTYQEDGSFLILSCFETWK